MTDLAAAIRELHAPTDDFWPTCAGCDSEGFEAETPSWPCRTARLVYTTDEILAYELESRKRRAAAQAQRDADPSPTASLVPALWGQQLVEQIKGSEWIMQALNTPPEHR